MARKSSSTSASAEPSQRQLRVGEMVRHALANLLLRGDVHDTALSSHVVTVPEVRMSPDLKIATVYVMPLGGDGGDRVVEALSRHKKYIRGCIAKDVNLKYMPDLRFHYDDTFDEVSRIDAIMRSSKVRQDLKND